MQNPLESHILRLRMKSQEHENFREFRSRSVEIKITPANVVSNVVTKRFVGVNDVRISNLSLVREYANIFLTLGVQRPANV